MKRYRRILSLVTLGLVLQSGFPAPPARGAEAVAKPTAAALLDHYRALPYPEKDDGGGARMARLKSLVRIHLSPEGKQLVQKLTAARPSGAAGEGPKPPAGAN